MKNATVECDGALVFIDDSWVGRIRHRILKTFFRYGQPGFLTSRGFRRVFRKGVVECTGYKGNAGRWGIRLELGGNAVALDFWNRA